jgi:triacylglycerol lipase
MNLTLAIECAEAIAAMSRGDLAATIEDRSTDTQVRIEQAHNGEFILIFPGTASRRDWRTDAKILKTDWNGDGAKTHSGFTEAYRSIGSQVCDFLREYQAERVIITGHSLGGALATLCADVVADLGVDIAGVYTFGSPRVGNRTFARQYNEDLAEVTYRVVNARDPVPWLPLPLWIPRTGIYTHVDSIVYLPHEGGIEAGAALLSHLGDAVATLRDQAQEQKFFGDVLTARCHSIHSYLEKLKGLHA